jgi:hypothetical protein
VTEDTCDGRAEDAAEIDAMAAAGAVVSEALQAIVEHAKPSQPLPNSTGSPPTC